MYYIKVSGLLIQVNNDNTDSVSLFNDYLVDTNDTPDIIVNNPKDYLDIHNQIASQLINFNGFLIHGACISYKDNAYLFIAPSHTGKTTHIKLWLKHLSDVKVIDGDKPIVRLINDEPIIFGTPWNGKERYGNNISSKLKSIIILHRSEVDTITSVNSKEYIDEIIKQVYIPEDNNKLISTLELIDSVFNKINIYDLHCTMNDSAFIKSFETLTGEKYESK